MHTLLNQRVASGDFWGGKDGFGCRSGGTSAWTGLAQVRVIPSSAEHLPRTQMHSVLSLNRPSSILCPQTFHCPLFIPCTSRSSSFPTPGNSQNNPMEGGEGTLASFRLHRTHTPTPHTTSGLSPILLQNHSRVFPSPVPAGGAARGTEPSLGAQVVPGGASRDAAHPSSPYLCGTAWSGRRQRWAQTPGLCRLG